MSKYDRELNQYHTPDSELKSLRKLVLRMTSDLAGAIYLGFRLADRDIRAQFRQTFLGILWIILIPLLNTVIWIVINLSLISEPSENNLSATAAYVFSGSLIWSIFADALILPLKNIVQSRNMLAKLNFKREALIISSIFINFFHSIIKLTIMLIGLALVSRVDLFSVPYALLGVSTLIIMGTFLGLLLAPVGLLYDDINKGLPMIAQFLAYTTPALFYPPPSGVYSLLLANNPLSWSINYVRDLVLLGGTDYTGQVITSLIATLIFLLMSWILLRVSFPVIIERLSN